MEEEIDYLKYYRTWQSELADHTLSFEARSLTLDYITYVMEEGHAYYDGFLHDLVSQISDQEYELNERIISILFYETANAKLLIKEDLNTLMSIIHNNYLRELSYDITRIVYNQLKLGNKVDKSFITSIEECIIHDISPLCNYIKNDIDNGLIRIEKEFDHVTFKTEIEVLEEFKVLNDLSDESINQLKKSLKTIQNYADDIKNWRELEIKTWQDETSVKEIADNIAKTITVVAKAVELTHKFYPNQVQIIAVLALIDNNTSKGKLAEISTGEGKSIIVAMFSAIKALLGEYVDIIISSSELSKRDALEDSRKIAFFRLFSLSTGENTHTDDKNLLAEEYKKKIVYGVVSSFAGDYLKHNYYDQNILGNRTQQNVIIDEVDSMLIDQNSHSIILSSRLASFEHLQPIYVAMWGHSLYIIQDLNNNNIKYDIMDLYGVLPEILTKVFTAALNQNNSPFIIPKHLKIYVNNQIDKWANSAVAALSYQKDINYLIIAGKIIPIDYQNTGTLQNNIHWSNGLHQFIQIKHQLKFVAESPEADYISNVGYFKKYQHIYGMTGTIGKESEKLLLVNTYHVDFIKIPTATHKRFEHVRDLIVKDAIWINTIALQISEYVGHGQAVLVIAKTIKDVTAIINHLKTVYPVNKIREYSRDDNVAQKILINQKVTNGDIIVATNLAGRGTDLTTDDLVEKNGGLHVIVTFLPINERVEKQAYGRTSRQGKDGSAQLILNSEITIGELTPYLRDGVKLKLDLKGVISIRDHIEELRLSNDIMNNLPMIELKDELFNLYANFLSQIKPIDDDTMYHRYAKRQIKEYWGIWLKSKQHMMNKRYAGESKDKAKKYYIQLKNQLTENFTQFAASINAKYSQRTLIENIDLITARAIEIEEIFSKINDKDFIFNEKIPLYQDEAPLKLLDRAIESDQIYSFAAYLARAKIVITKDGENKQLAYDNLQLARTNIVNEIIPRLAGMIYLMANIQNVADVNHQTDLNINSDFVKQILFKIHLLNKHVEYIDKASSMIMNSEEKLIKVQKIIAIYKVLDRCASDDITTKQNSLEINYENTDCYNGDLTNYEDEIVFFDEINMLESFEISYYTPRDNSGFLDAVFVAFIAIFEIIIGGFVTVAFNISNIGLLVGKALIADGMGDLMKAVVSTFTTRGMDLDQHLNNKGVNFAISYVATVLSEHFKLFQKPGAEKAKYAKDVPSDFKEGIFDQVINNLQERGQLAIVTAGLQMVGDKIVDQQRGDIKEDIIDALNAMFNKHKEAVNKIIGTDKANGSSYNYDSVIARAQEVANQYIKKYNSKEESFIKGVASNVANPVFGFMAAGTTIVEAWHKMGGAADKFADSIGVKIVELASNIKTKDILAKVLLEIFAEIDARSVINTLTANNLIVGGDFNYQACAQVAMLEYVKIDDHSKVINSKVIEAICQGFAEIFGADYSSKIEELKAKIAGVATGVVISTTKKELVGTISDIVAREGIAEYKAYLKRSKDKQVIDIIKEEKERAHEENEEEDEQTKAETKVKREKLADIHKPESKQKNKAEDKKDDKPKGGGGGAPEQPIQNQPAKEKRKMSQAEIDEYIAKLQEDPVMKLYQAQFAETMSKFVKEFDSKSDAEKAAIYKDMEEYTAQTAAKKKPANDNSKIANDYYGENINPNNYGTAKELFNINKYTGGDSQSQYSTVQGPHQPTIEFVARDALPGLMHGFTIFTDSYGNKRIITGFPTKENLGIKTGTGIGMMIGDLEIFDIEYSKFNQYLIDEDWETNYRTKSDKYKIILTKQVQSDQELGEYLQKARIAIKDVRSSNNGKNYDYDLCLTSKCSGANSNTVQRIIHDAMGTSKEVLHNIPRGFINGIILPGIKGEFYNGPLDNIITNVIEQYHIDIYDNKDSDSQ